MPEDLKSFLISVSIILAVALFVPCIESVAKLLRRASLSRGTKQVKAMKPSKRFTGEAA